MKLTCVLLAIGFTSFQLLMAGDTRGQDLRETKIAVGFKNESLQQAFSTIEKLTELRFAYNPEQASRYKNITLERGTYSVQKVLEVILSGTTLLFRQVNNKIIIYNKPDPVSTNNANITINHAPQGGNIRGRVVTHKNEPLIAASVTLGPVGRATTADNNGEFSFSNINPGKYKIQVSAIGFKEAEREVTVVEDQTVQANFQLAPVNSALDEVVVTGYSKQSKRDVTGAVSTISSDVIEQTPVTDITAVLQGRVAGVTVDGQGGPGNEQVVRIRGIGTLGNNDPLYVIDGVQTTGGLNLINTSDIESITVLKDAASCALYGARGSNGVIVITTKRGKTGTPKFEYNSYAGYELPRKSIKVITPQQYADAYWGYLKNSGLNLSSALYGSGANPVLPDYFISKRVSPTFAAVKEGDPLANPSLYNFSTYRIMKTNKQGTNWFDELFDPALTQSHQLAVSGASDKSNYAVTFNYLDNKGILLYSFFKRYSIRANTEYKIKPWLRVGENMQFAYTQGNTVNNHTDQNIFAGIYNTSPLLPVYDIEGNYTGTNGAPGELQGDNLVLSRVGSKQSKGYSARLLGSAYAEIEPIKNLVLQTKIAVDYAPFQSRFFQDTMPQVRYPVTSLKFSESAGHSFEWRSTTKISYAVAIGEHKVSAFAAYEASRYTFRYLGAGSDSVFYNLPGFMVTSTNTGIRWQASGSADMVTYVSQFGSLNYSYADKYLAAFTVRRDGTSRFTSLKRYGVFPSASVGWRISAEKFMENATWLNDLKLRGSLGTSGNDAIGTGLTTSQYYTNPMYTYYDLNVTNSSAMPGFALTQIGNPFLQWEVNQTTNIGFDASLLNNTLTASFNWFKRKTDKLLYQPPITALQGDAGAPYQNVMNFTNKGIELELGYRPSGKRKFNYAVNANIATYRNNVDYIDGKPETFILGGLYARAINLSRSTVGEPVGSFYGYIYDGMIQTGDSAGHFRFKDIAGGADGKPDGKIDDKDRTFIGSPHPQFTYGVNIDLSYKNFDASVFFQGVYGNKIFNYWRAFTQWPGKLGEGSLDTWSPGNTAAKLPVYNNKDFDDDRPSTFFIENGSYLRLKSVQVGYTFPRTKGIDKLRVYVQGYNLFTITKYTGLDPEVSNGEPGSAGIDFGGHFPISTKILFGVNLNL